MEELLKKPRGDPICEGPGLRGLGFIPGWQEKLLDLPLKQPNMSENKDDPALSEWVVGVNREDVLTRTSEEICRYLRQSEHRVLAPQHPYGGLLRKAFGITQMDA